MFNKICVLKVSLCYALLIVFFSQTKVLGAYFINGVWEVTVVRAMNPQLPTFTVEQLKESLKETQLLFKKKFNTRVHFLYSDAISVKDLFEKHLKEHPEEAKKIFLENEFQLFGAEQGDLPIPQDKAIEALSSIGLPVIKKFFQGHPSCVLETLQDAYKCLNNSYKQSRVALWSIKNDPSLPYFKNYPLEYDSSSHWTLVATHETRWDVIITNDALIREYFPIGIGNLHGFYKGLSHGFSIPSSPYSSMDRRATVISIFPFYTGSSFFEERAGYPSEKLKTHLIGEILAHELGHLLFYMPEGFVVEEPAGCVMYRDWVTMKDTYRYPLVNRTQACFYEVGWVILSQSVEKWYVDKDPLAIQAIGKIEAKSHNVHWQFMLDIADAYLHVGSKNKAIQVFKKILRFVLPDDVRNMVNEEMTLLQQSQ